MTEIVQGGRTIAPSTVTPSWVCRIATPIATRRSFTSIASAPAAARLLIASSRSSALSRDAAMTMTTQGPCTGTSPSMARSRLASAVSSWSAADVPPDCSAVFCRFSSVVSPESASLARCRASIKNASVVEWVPTRLRSTSTWLRIWIVATSATSSAMSQISIARLDRPPLAAVRLGRVDMGDLEARVVGRHLDVGQAGDRQLDLKAVLAVAQVWKRRWLLEPDDNVVSVADRKHLDGCGERRALVDDDLPLRAREGAERRDPPAVHGDRLRAMREEEVDHVLDVLVVDQVADLPIDVGARRPVREVDLYPRTVNRRQPGMGAQVGDLVVKGLGGRRVLGGGALERVDVRPQGGDLGAQLGVGLLQVLDAAHERLVTGDLVGGRQELSLDLARHQEPCRERDRRDDKDTQDAVARHYAILVDRGSAVFLRFTEYHRKPHMAVETPVSAFQTPQRPFGSPADLTPLSLNVH